MIDYNQATIENVVVHHIGTRSEGESIKFSKTVLHFDDEELIEDVLKPFFFRSFKSEAYYNFDHETDIEKNHIFGLAKQIFADATTFYDTSILLAEYLYENSNHPKIRGGEFYVALFDNVVVDGEIVSALGIFKSENKETFLKVYLKDNCFELGSQEGINIKRIDKGCLIFNTEEDLGFKVCSIDNINKGNDANFWMKDFLNVKPREDNFYFTQNYLKMCKGFVSDVYNNQNEVPRPDQIDLLNRSINFFDDKIKFSEQEFEREIFKRPEEAEAFKEYKETYEQEHDIPLTANFDISHDAVKGEKKNFKSILKLDKNFHVYIHGKRDYLEKGFDERRGMNYYKLYYQLEQ